MTLSPKIRRRKNIGFILLILVFMCGCAGVFVNTGAAIPYRPPVLLYDLSTDAENHLYDSWTPWGGMQIEMARLQNSGLYLVHGPLPLVMATINIPISFVGDIVTLVPCLLQHEHPMQRYRMPEEEELDVDLTLETMARKRIIERKSDDVLKTIKDIKRLE